MVNTEKIKSLKGRSFLLLQGPIGPFFFKLARALQAVDAEVTKINFNGGCEFFYNCSSKINFEQDIEKLPDFLRQLAKDKSITDLIVYGDCRPIHKVAISTLKEIGIKIHVLEEGYFRPSWITLERDGVNFYSSLPREADFYLAQKIMALPRSQAFRSPFKNLVLYAVQYYIFAVIAHYRKKFTGYKHHFECGPHKAFWSWLPRLFTKFTRGIEAKLLTPKIRRTKYFLVPLQLCRDFQVKEHSNFRDMAHFIEHIIQNFAKDAPADVSIIIKKHPLDSGLIGLRKIVTKEAEKAGIRNRIIFLDGGNLPMLINKSLGVITINSTAGLQAIHHKTPTLVLGRSFYAIDGMVNKTDLKTFLHSPQLPDDNLYQHFRNYVIQKTQINGGFYNKLAMDMAINGIIKRISTQNESESLPANYPEFHGSQKVS